MVPTIFGLESSTAMDKYLVDSEVIDWRNPEIVALAAELASGCRSPEQIARLCFEWVRDKVRHSWDYKLDPVTWKASEVLRHRTGYCYAKSHLLAALLRANDIPAGFCYQRLSLEGGGAPYCLHGLNALYLPVHGWYRGDARGNKAGIDAQFDQPTERLAFAASGQLEADFPEIWTEPLTCVVTALKASKDHEDAYRNLPDVEIARGC